jgi:hypothetical protein
MVKFWVIDRVNPLKDEKVVVPDNERGEES